MCYFTWKLELTSLILQLIVSKNTFLTLHCPTTLQTSFLQSFWEMQLFWHCFNLKLEQLTLRKGKNFPLLKTAFPWRRNLVLKPCRILLRTLLKNFKKVFGSIWLFLTKLVVNKNIKSKTKFCRQSVSYYFETFQCFTKFFIHHRWNDGGLLLIKMVYMSCLTSCQKI